MDKVFGIVIVLLVSLLLVFGIFEIGISQYGYYLDKGFSEETASLFSFFGLIIGIGLTVVLVKTSSLLKDETK